MEMIYMINNSEIKEVLSNHPGLLYEKAKNKFKGILEVNHIYNDEHIISSKKVTIFVPENYPINIPTVKIPLDSNLKEFNHMYLNGRICLGTPLEQRIFFSEGNTLNQWINEFVIPYLFSFEYFKKYNIYLFGGYSHKYGRVENYCDLFNIVDPKAALNFIRYILSNKIYRGHALCPCGSGRPIRNCHKDVLLKWMQPKYKNILKIERKENKDID